MDALHGTWRLLSWSVEDKDGNISHPMGEDTIGHICYAPDGFVHVHLMASNRPTHASPDTLGGTLEEDSRSAKSHISYSGRWHLEDGLMVHDLEMCSFPNWVGSRQERVIEHFDGAELTLSTPSMPWNGTEIRHHLKWTGAT